MKKIINGRKYDTETAKFIAKWDNDELGGRYVEEKLYRKKTGEFFIDGYGGAMSKYCRAVGNACIEGREIVPISKDEAKEWLEKYSTCEIYEEIFGEVGE